MIPIAIVLVCVGLFVILCWFLEDKVERAVAKLRKLMRWTKHLDDRISSLEVRETSQDERLDQHDQRFHEDERAVRMLSKEVGELGEDVGWDDDKRKTEVLTIDPPDDDSNPL